MRPTVPPADTFRTIAAPRSAYLMAVLLPASAVVATVAVSRLLDGDVGVPLLSLGVFLTALAGGLVPGVVATLLSAVLEVTREALTAGTPGGPTAVEAPRIILFVAAGLLVSWASGLVLRARARAELDRGHEGGAHLASQAIDGALSYEAERSSRQQAEASRQRLDLLADAGRILGASLDYETTLEALARLALPVLGDCAIVDLVEADGTSRRIVVTASPVEAAAASVLQDHPVDLGSENPVAEAIRSGRTLVVDIDDEVLRHIGQTAVHQEAIRGMGICRAMVVAIRLRDRSIGSLLFATADPRRQYDSADIAMAEGLAQRAAHAIDNGRMHREIQRLAEHEQLRAAELESILSAMGEGIVVCGPDSAVRSMNEAAERILGGPIADLDGLRSRVNPHGGALLPPGVAFGPVECQLIDRRSTWVELTAYAVARDPESGSAGGTVYVMRDVTAFRQGQRLREAFLSLLSHELRTPVTTIYAAANVLGKPGSTLAPDTRLEILGDMVGESNRLYRLVEDLMVLARFDEGLDLAHDPNLLQHVVPAVVASERTRWPNVQFRVTSARDLPTVSGDETSIQQVLRNLLSNAAKYGPSGSVVEVLVAAERDGATVRVLDEGVGIRTDEVEDLFDPFYRSPSTAKLASGAGIGLYVCRRLIDAMGGHIWARPRPGSGSEFAFWLPRYAGTPDDPIEAGLQYGIDEEVPLVEPASPASKE